MKTRTNKLYHNLTKKQRKKFSRKKKTYKNKTLKGGNPIIIASVATVAGVAAGGAAWLLIRRRMNLKNDAINKAATDNVYEDDDPLLSKTQPQIYEDDVNPPPPPQLISFTIPHMVRKGRGARMLPGLRRRDQITLTCENFKEKTAEIFKTYYYTNEHFQNFTREIGKLNEQIDKPKVGGVLLMRNKFLETPSYKKQIESYKILRAYIPSESKAEAQGLQKAAPIKRQQILYEDNNNYYCIDNTYQIGKDFMIKLEPLPRARRGGSRVESQSDILDDLTIDGVAKDPSKYPSVKGKMKNVFGTLLSYFLSDGSNAEAATLIFDFYNENIELQNLDDSNIIKTFIFDQAAYKEYIETKGTNARKKIELLNLISSNTICKFLMDYVEQELSEKHGITKGTQIYKLVSESIRINWRINNIYGENKQEKPPDGHNLYLKEGGDRYKYLIDPKFVGGATRVDKSPTQGIRVGFPDVLKGKAVLDRKKRDGQRRLRERDLARFIPFIKKNLDTLVSKKQIPYEVLLVLLGLILSGNEDIIEEEKILAINIIYNEIVRYGSQNLYDVPIEGTAINTPRPHRDQAALMQRPVIAIPKIELEGFISDKTIISAFGSGSDTVAVYGAVDNLMTNLKFGEFVEEYFTTLVHNCQGKSEKDILEIEKEALYSIIYFTLKGTDKEWELKGETTINKFRKNLEILLPKVDFSKLTLDTFNEEFAKLDWDVAHPVTGTPGSKIAESIKLIIMNRLYKLLEA